MSEDELPGRTSLAEHNVMATFSEAESARTGFRSLERAGFDAGQISFLSRADESTVVPGEPPSDVVKGVATGGAAGSAVGGALGFIAGAVAFGIPGVGPAVGAGIWAATAGGAAAGATAGGVASGIREMWEARYRDSLNEGSILIGFHDDDESEVDRAQKLLESVGADRIDRFGSDGRLPPDRDPTS